MTLNLFHEPFWMVEGNRDNSLPPFLIQPWCPLSPPRAFGWWGGMLGGTGFSNQHCWPAEPGMC